MVVPESDACCLFLEPIAWIGDGFWSNSKLSAQSIQKCFYSLYLRVGQGHGFAVGYNANADSFAGAVPCGAWYEGPLPFPLFCCLYLPVIAAAAVT